MQNPNAGHRERLRERFLNDGLDGFQDHEVLELLLFQCIPQKDTNRLAHNLLDKFGSLPGVLNAPVASLCEVKGVSKVTATNLAVLREIYFRYKLRIADQNLPLKVTDAVSYAQKVLTASNVERLLIFYFDHSSRIIARKMYCSNRIDTVDVSVKTLVADAIGYAAAGAILFHNHPGGKATPSKSDEEFTENLYMSLRGIGIVLVDHCIFSDNDVYSFKTTGKMDTLAEKYH